MNTILSIICLPNNRGFRLANVVCSSTSVHAHADMVDATILRISP